MAAWVYGNPYGIHTWSTKLGVQGVNPCSIPSMLDGVADLSFQGCGATPLWINLGSRWVLSCSSNPVEFQEQLHLMANGAAANTSPCRSYVATQIWLCS